MAFSDEIFWEINAIRQPSDEVGLLTDSISWVLLDFESGTTVTSGVGAGTKEGTTWRQEIYHSRRVERQGVLG